VLPKGLGIDDAYGSLGHIDGPTIIENDYQMVEQVSDNKISGNMPNSDIAIVDDYRKGSPKAPAEPKPKKKGLANLMGVSLKASLFGSSKKNERVPPPKPPTPPPQDNNGGEPPSPAKSVKFQEPKAESDDEW